MRLVRVDGYTGGEREPPRPAHRHRRKGEIVTREERDRLLEAWQKLYAEGRAIRFFQDLSPGYHCVVGLARSMGIAVAATEMRPLMMANDAGPEFRWEDRDLIRPVLPSGYERVCQILKGDE